uniref:Signal transducer and activator of transcription n=1 Tax=Erpetoichthys calabaricus TaxID=27687 RepID=A0A8C4SHN9_ERPCA
MAQWECVVHLDTAYLQKVDDLYSDEAFPMDVRHYLALWIESQDWVKATQDESLASVLFHILLENLDNQYSYFSQTEGSFLQQCNIRKFKQNFQAVYQEEPRSLARVICMLLAQEKEIIREAQLAEKVQMLQVQPSQMELDNQRNMERKFVDLRSRVQEMDQSVKLLEEQQDEFDFRYKIHLQEGEQGNNGMKYLQELLNKLDASRKNCLARMRELLSEGDALLNFMVNEELRDWTRRQQKACIGAPEDVSLDVLENWFTVEAECLFHLRRFLKKLEELCGKVTYERDPFKVEQPDLQKQVDHLLTTLLKSAFVVEKQPIMPQGKGPLVLRTSVQFSVKTRLLVKFPELNHSMKVTAVIDRDVVKEKGYRRFNILGTSSKALTMSETSSSGMVAEFRHLTLKEQKAGGGGKGCGEGTLSVTEELHILSFETHFNLHGLSVDIQASSLPVVIISNSSQQQSAWASILWFNTLCSDPKNLSFFSSPMMATWAQFSDMLSWQFQGNTKRGLNDDQKLMIAHKLFGRQPSYDNCLIPWARFSKENLPDVNFSFCAWIDGILTLVKSYLEDLWNDGYIMGFVSKKKEKTLLKGRLAGTFLLRFSESCRDGAITFSWVEHLDNGKANVRSVKPFTKQELSQIPFSEVIHHFQILVAENVPENPLHYLYPDIPKDDAFGKYYAQSNQGEESRMKAYLGTRLIVVCPENTTDVQTPAPADTEHLEEGVQMSASFSAQMPAPEADFSLAIGDFELMPTELLLADNPGNGIEPSNVLLNDPLMPTPSDFPTLEASLLYDEPTLQFHDLTEDGMWPLVSEAHGQQAGYSVPPILLQ